MPEPQQQDLVIRPTLKFVRIRYIVAAAMVVAGLWFVYAFQIAPHQLWVGALPGLALFLSALYRHVALLASKLVISTDRLHHEAGFLAKSTHTIDLIKVQDVRVDQTMFQRAFNVGKISVETSGGSSAISIDNVDNPQTLANLVLERSKHHP